jgi:FtsP/CotA-like multicopper oxidase with cupredoxin domain
VFDSVAPATEETPTNFPVNGGLFPLTRVDQPKAGTVEEWTILNHSSLHHPFHLHVQYGR